MSVYAVLQVKVADDCSCITAQYDCVVPAGASSCLIGAYVDDVQCIADDLKQQEGVIAVELLATSPYELPLGRTSSANGGLSFEEDGLMVRRGLIPSELVDQVLQVCLGEIERVEAVLQERGVDWRHQPFSFREVASRETLRYDVRLDWQLYTSLERIVELVRPVAVQLLATQKLDINVDVVYSLPGATAQQWHADAPHISQDRWAAAYGCCCFLPLIALSEQTGYTQFYLGSHSIDLPGFGPTAELTRCTWDALGVPGDAVLYDYRTIHRGMPNNSASIRPVLQLIFTTPIYKEHYNFDESCSLFDST